MGARPRGRQIRVHSVLLPRSPQTIQPRHAQETGRTWQVPSVTLMAPLGPPLTQLPLGVGASRPHTASVSHLRGAPGEAPWGKPQSSGTGPAGGPALPPPCQWTVRPHAGRSQWKQASRPVAAPRRTSGLLPLRFWAALSAPSPLLPGIRSHIAPRALCARNPNGEAVPPPGPTWGLM